MKASERPQTYGLARVSNRIGILVYINIDICQLFLYVNIDYVNIAPRYNEKNKMC
jgi:hypothetical protein